jgi:hypothetical protein
MALDPQNVIRLVYGDGDFIYYSTSIDKGKTFSESKRIGEIAGMHLGMSRGPQIASSKDYSIVTAMDKKGNIHAFRLTHKSVRWEPLSNVNDIDGSAPEGLMSIAADADNNFYAVWLDVREDHQNNICFSVLQGDGNWSKNKFVYRSPDGHVCECCKPSIAVKGDRVSIMFRNWITGSRDLYLISSLDRGEKFGECTRLGNGTWPLNGCPMDGGGLAVNSDNLIQTAWQREGNVFYCEPGKPEQKISEGRGVGITDGIVYWQKGSALFVKQFQHEPQKIGEGTAINVMQLERGKIIAIWSNEMQIMLREL